MPALRPKFWRELDALIAEHNSKKVNGTTSSQKTQENRRKAIHEGFNVLAKEFHCRLLSPTQFREKHMFKLVHYWEENNCKDIQTRISYFRTFGNIWLGKGGGNMIKESARYATNPESVKRKYVTNQDKTWSGNGVDIEAKLEELYKLDKRVGLITELCLAFGLRHKEALLIHSNEDDRGENLHIQRGSKGGRKREVKIEHMRQRAILDRAKTLANRQTGSLIPDGIELKVYKQHVYYVLRKAGISKKQSGVTLHGLRHEYAVRFYEGHAGTKAPLKEGHVAPEAEAEKQVKEDLAETLGHSRTHIVGCYIGSRNYLRKSKKNGPAQPADESSAAAAASTVIQDDSE